MTTTHPAAWHAGHGYTLADLDRLARTAAATAYARTLDPSLRYNLAWSAIAEHLTAADQPPTTKDLINTAHTEIATEFRAVMHARGSLSPGTPTGSSPVYWRYWWRPTEERAEDRITDRIAVGQVLHLLTPAQLDAIAALAEHDDYQTAADALGMPYKRFAGLIARARRTVWDAWYAPETPPPRRYDRRRGKHAPRSHCSAGHALDGDNVLIRIRRRGRRERVCRACQQARKARWQTGKTAA